MRAASEENYVQHLMHTQLAIVFQQIHVIIHVCVVVYAICENLASV